MNGSVCWMRKGRRVEPGAAPVKVNLGCGLTVAPGWINIDASINALISNWPRPLLNYFYGISGSRKHYSAEHYCQVLSSHYFVHHNCKYGIPLPDASVDYVYSSHMLEHMYIVEGQRLLGEAGRVLKKGGVIRVCVPDLEFALSLYQGGQKQKAMQYFFSRGPSGELFTHRYMYDFDLLSQALRDAGFGNIERQRYQQGRTPDLELLDMSSEVTLFVEAEK